MTEEQKAIVLARMQRNECPICGHTLEKAVTVNDARFGKIRVCNTHHVAKAGVG